MKHSFYILIILCTAISFNVSAQFSLGAKAGYVKAWQDYGDAEIPDDAIIHVNGFEVALLAYYDLGQRFSIGLEPGYVQRGAACVPGFVQFNSDTRLYLDYVELPFYLSYKIPVFGDKFEFFGKLGYGPTMMVSAKGEVWDLDTNTLIEEWDIDTNNEDWVNKWGHAAAVGLGVNYVLGKSKVFMESRYTYSFVDAIPFEDSQNRSINIDIGYLFSF